MSGHSKWHSIKHKKGIADAKRGKIFTKHAKLIAIAAQKGGEPETNPTLRTAIDNAKVDNMPAANIDRAIKKGTGEDKEGLQIFEVLYEGYGPAGTAILVESLTDNKNRTVSSIKTIFAKNGGNMAAAGSVAWMFDKKGVISMPVGGKNVEEIELDAIDAGADDFEIEEGDLQIYTDPTQLAAVKQALQAKGYQIQSANLSYIAKNDVKIEKEGDATKVLKLMSALEEDEDVGDVYSNFDISESLLEKLS